MSKFNPTMLRVYFIGGTQNINGDADKFIQQLELACQNGITMFQYREKDHGSLTGEKRIEMAKRVREITAQYDIPLIIDDDLQLAKAIDADGIHVGQSDTPIQKIVQAAGDMIVGLSVHDPAELAQSGDLTGVDYLGVGPVAGTHSKDKVKQPIGIEGLQKMLHASTKPIVAIGGIHHNNIKNVLETNVSGVAVISDIMDSDDVAATINELKGLDVDVIN